MDSDFIKTLRGQEAEHVPFWFMRQAGRYLPEYQEVRKKAGGFFDLCYSPSKAAEVTLQPVRRFDVSAAIIFSDILVLPQALGVGVDFVESQGPVISPWDIEKYLQRLDTAKLQSHTAPVMEALKLVRSELPQDKALIGFAGAPWTIASYMVEGKLSKDLARVRACAYHRPGLFSQLIEVLTEATIDYLSRQIESGADALQLFDSWAMPLPQEEFAQWCLAPAKKITHVIKQKYDVPIIAFARTDGANFLRYAAQSGADAVGVETSVSMRWARDHTPLPLQGNLDPVLLMTDKAKTLQCAAQLIETMKDRPFVFNLGHGILQHTPPENVAALSAYLRGVKR